MKRPPPIDWEPYHRAETYLQTELVSAEEAELLARYRAAVDGRRVGEALACLVELGDRQGCTNPYWQALERIAVPPRPRLKNPDRRAQGRLDALIEYIQRRARGEPG